MIIISQDRKKILRKIEFLKRDYADGKFTQAEYERALRAYTSELDTLQSVNKVRVMQGKERPDRNLKKSNRDPNEPNKRSQNPKRRRPVDSQGRPIKQRRPRDSQGRPVKRKIPVDSQGRPIKRRRPVDSQGRPIKHNVRGYADRKMSKKPPKKENNNLGIVLAMILIVSFVIGISFGTLYLTNNPISATQATDGVLKVNETTFPPVIIKETKTNQKSNSTYTGDTEGTTDTPSTDTPGDGTENPSETSTGGSSSESSGTNP